MPSHPRIVCKAGPSLAHLEEVDVNRAPLAVSSPHWEGNIAVRLKDYRGPVEKEGEYERNPREKLMNEGDTWSISFEGRWKDDGLTADDVLFGNVWQKPIRDFLPYGTAAALRFVRYVDPTLDCDLYADKPWALSPLFATLQYLYAVPHPSSDPIPSFKPDTFAEDVTPLLPSSAPSLAGNPTARRSYFSKADARQSTSLKQDHLLRGDFSHGFLNFDTLSLSLPGGLSFSLEKYWNGEPVVFSCQKRGTGEEYFVVTFELEAEDGGRLAAKGAKGAEEEKEEVSEDVD
ncbi:hypothetical protein JCM10450v2_003522 [Rhodotorula kratochvilovae]